MTAVLQNSFHSETMGGGKMIDRRIFVLSVAAILAVPGAAHAHPAKKPVALDPRFLPQLVDTARAASPFSRFPDSSLSAMDKLLIRGGRALHGEVTVSGAKNAALPELCAALLSSEPVTLRNVPRLQDVSLRPPISGKKCQGTVAAHKNGLRFTSVKREIVDILYSNVRHAVYQPCENSLYVIIHFVLRNGIMIGKIQVSSCPEIDFSSSPEEKTEALTRFIEARYLHQTVLRDDQGEHEFVEDLDLALKTREKTGVWRVHFHIPLFADRLGVISTTQGAVEECLHALGDDIPPLEVETYAWNVLPSSLIALELSEGISREIEWLQALIQKMDGQ